MHTNVEENQHIELKAIKNIFTDFTVKITDFWNPHKISRTTPSFHRTLFGYHCCKLYVDKHNSTSTMTFVI